MQLATRSEGCGYQRVRFAVSTRPLPKASIRPHRPGMSSSSRWPMPAGSAGSTTRWSPMGSRPSIVRSKSSGVPVDQAWGLHAVGYWTGYLRQAPFVAAERLRQPPVEELGRVEDAGGDLRRLLLEAVAPQAPGDERVVERPDRADVVADRVVAAFALGQGAHAPAGEQSRAHQVSRDRLAPWTCRRCRSRAGGRCSSAARRPGRRPGRAPGRSTRRPRPRSRG